MVVTSISSLVEGTGGVSILDTSQAVPGGSLARSTKQVKFTNSTQTGKNVSKVRWLLDDSFFSVPDPLATEYFVTGSWSWVEEKNDLSLWKLAVGRSPKEGEKDAKVTLVEKALISGSVTGLSCLSSTQFCACTSEGALYMYKCNCDRDDNLTSITESASAQLFKCRNEKRPATAVAVKDDRIITVGEDGSIVECCSDGLRVVRRFDKADPLSISALCILGRDQIMTGNGGGQLKLWDLRGPSEKPLQILNPNVLMNNLYGVSSICQHPSQSHAIIVGYQSGCMDLWDLRSGPDCDPVANLASEGGSLSEIYFHQVNPDHFFSCAQSGQVCHWYPADRLSNSLQVPVEYTSDLNIEFLKRGLVFKEIHTSPFCINSINLSKNDRLVVGSDSGIVSCTEIRL